MSPFLKRIDYNQLSHIQNLYPGKTIAHCHGVFDLLHYGHLKHLQEAKEQGDILVVTVTPDKYVNKGPHRPYHAEQKRLEMLAHLDIVDHVALNQSQTAVEPIKLLQPNLFIKGPDYKDASADETGAIDIERQAVESVGGKLVCTNGIKDSSTSILNQYFSTWTDVQKQAIAEIKKTVSLKDVQDALDECANLKVLVIGEPIIDSYVFCRCAGTSSKTPTIAAQYVEKEQYAGGSLVVANQVASLGCETTLLLPSAQEDSFLNLLGNELLSNVNVEHFFTEGFSTPEKTRFLTRAQTQQMLELINVPNDYWQHNNPELFIEKLHKLSKQHDLIILSDFGHGLFEKDVVDSITKIDNFVALTVQTKAGNFGFNPYTKHNRFDFLCMDESELRVATRDRLSDIIELSDKVVCSDIKKDTAITLGAQGSVFYADGEIKHTFPGIFSEVVDAVGAGDAYFSIASLLARLRVKHEMIPFLGNCFAGLHTQVIGNKHPVGRSSLNALIKSILQ